MMKLRKNGHGKKTATSIRCQPWRGFASVDVLEAVQNPEWKFESERVAI
jgi:hypothetical protein